MIKKMEEEVEDWVENRGVDFLERVGIESGQVVLDFGCGRGNYSVSAARVVGEDGLVYVLDKNNERLNELVGVAKKQDLKNIKRIDVNGELKIPLEDKSIDAVLLYDVIHLVGKNDSSTVIDRKKLYEEIYRVAKDDVLISVYPTHLTTHTDIVSLEEVRQEIEQYFKFEKRIFSRLVHDDNIENGEVLNFRGKVK